MLKLVIADKNYSSWSMRPWLMMIVAEIPFEEVFLHFNMPGWKAQVREYSPAGCVPILVDGDITIWESVAILDYLHEAFPDSGIWPEDRAARAVSRSVSMEMATGFRSLRAYYPMNIRRHVPDRPPTDEVKDDIERICAIWRDMRERFGDGGYYLCGPNFSGVDAMYAPVVSRFMTYDVEVGDVERAYMNAIAEHPAFEAWKTEAMKEPWIVEEDEV